MERETNPMQQTLCRSGCGFYGSQSTEGLCSICYKESLRKKQQPPVSSTPVTVPSPQPSPTFKSVAALSTTTIITQNNQTNNNNSSSTPAHTAAALAAAIPAGAPTAATQSLQPPVINDIKEKLGEIAANISKEEIAAAAAAAVTSIAAAAGPSAPPTEGDKDKDDEKDDGKNIKKKNRCGECRKKLGLTGFECRCGGLYCAIHRYSDKHNCTFNYREHGAQEIRRNNPVVVGEKIQKI